MNNQQIVLKALNESLEAAKSLNMTKFVPELEEKIKVIEAGDMIAVERELAVMRSKSVIFGNHDHIVPAKTSRPQSIRRNRYKLRGLVDSHLSISGETNAQIKQVLDELIEMLDGIVTNRMINFEYVYTRNTGIVAERKTNEYRFSSPVKHISMEVRRFKFGEQVIIKLYEHHGHIESVMFDSSYNVLNEVVKGFRTASRRLIGK